MRVLIFGDSIAQGFFDKSGGWVNRLREYFDTKLVENNDLSQPTVFNLGVSGDFTSSIIKRIENEIKARIWPGEEFVFVIATGTNDTLYRGDETESTPQKYKEELEQILSITKKYSHKIMFVGLFPVIDNLLQPAPFSESGKCYSTERMKLFDDTLKEFCSENNLSYVDVWQKFAEQDSMESLFYDGIHPNDDGHQVIYETVKPKLEEITK